MFTERVGTDDIWIFQVLTNIWDVIYQTTRRHISEHSTLHSIIKPTTWNDTLHEISNDNGIRAVYFHHLENLIAKSAASHIAKSIQVADKILCSEIQKLFQFDWNKEELPQQWK
jgi:hypothetical protein